MGGRFPAESRGWRRKTARSLLQQTLPPQMLAASLHQRPLDASQTHPRPISLLQAELPAGEAAAEQVAEEEAAAEEVAAEEVAAEEAVVQAALPREATPLPTCRPCQSETMPLAPPACVQGLPPQGHSPTCAAQVHSPTTSSYPSG